MKDFKKKWQNYWYYNKGKTIIALFLVIIIGVTIYETLTNEKYDMKVYLYISEDVSDASIRAFENTLEEYYGEKEKQNIEVISYSYDPYATESESISAKASAFLAEISLQTDFLIITDDYRFEDICTNETFNNMFEKQSFFADKDSLALSLKDSEFEKALKKNLEAQGLTVEQFPSLYLSVIDGPEKGQKGYENYKKSVDLAKRIVQGEK